MKGMNQQQCLDLVKKDIIVVRDEAIGVIIISPDNKSFELVENENPRLGVLAIIGPAQGFGKEFDKALLAEIGLGPSRPYHEARGLNRQPNQPNIPQRRKWFDLSTEQYCLVAPFVFKFILEKSQQKIANWKSGPYFWLPTKRSYWSHRQKQLFSSVRRREWPQGTRFSFSKKDKLLLADLFWAELNLNKQTIHELNGLAGYIDKRLLRYRNDQFYKGVRPFKELTAARDIEDAVYRLPLHLRKAVLKYLPGDRRNYFYSELQKLFGLENIEDLAEQTFAQQAENLAKPEKRLGNIQLRITTGLDKGKDYVVFEVFPPVKPKEDAVPF